MITTKRTQSRRGSAVLEAALVFPILISLSFGWVEFGRFFFIKHTLQSAAREGARAAVTSTSGDGNTLVTSAVSTSLTAAGIIPANYTLAIRNSTDTTNITAGTQTAGTAILIKITCSWGTVGLRPLGIMPTSKQVIGTTTMRKEG